MEKTIKKELSCIKTLFVNLKKHDEELVSIIKPKSGWQIIDVRELLNYLDLIYFLVLRDVKVLYAQTVLGFCWAILNPVVQIVIFTIVFGNVAKVNTDGIPYAMFSCVAIVPWAYMSQAMTQSSQCLVMQQNMLGKIYFPRLIFPITPILARLIDFSISILVILALSIYYRIYPTASLVYFPFFVLMMVMISAGVGMWLSSMAIRFRDVKYAMPFLIQMLMYSAPIVYSASSVPEKYRLIYSLNPIVGVIEGFRASLLGLPIPWTYIFPGILTTILLFVSGAYYFKRMEKIFVDVI